MIFSLIFLIYFLGNFEIHSFWLNIWFMFPNAWKSFQIIFYLEYHKNKGNNIDLLSFFPKKIILIEIQLWVWFDLKSVLLLNIGQVCFHVHLYGLVNYLIWSEWRVLRIVCVIVLCLDATLHLHHHCCLNFKKIPVCRTDSSRRRKVMLRMDIDIRINKLYLLLSVPIFLWLIKPKVFLFFFIFPCGKVL